MPDKIHKGHKADGHSAHPVRVKDRHQDHNDMTHGLSDNTKSFYNELIVLFPELRLTSGKRDNSPSGGFSHHHEGDAFDIGAEHTDVYEYLNNTPEGLDLMNRHGFGILDETDPRNMKKTNATGAHFHIGKDSKLYANTKTRYQQMDNIQPIYSFKSKNPSFDYSNLDNLDGADLTLAGTSLNEEQSIQIPPEMVGADPRLSAEFKVVLPNKVTADQFKEEVLKETTKAELKFDAFEASDARKLLAKKDKEAQEKIENVFNTLGTIRKRDQQSQVRPDSNQVPVYNQSDPIELQQGLPSLPNLPKFPDGGTIRGPIVVTDKDDPRYTAYQDSLLLSNQSVAISKVMMAGDPTRTIHNDKDLRWSESRLAAIDRRVADEPDFKPSSMRTRRIRGEDIHWATFDKPKLEVVLKEPDPTLETEATLETETTLAEVKPNPNRSLVDNLNVKGMDASFEARKVLYENSGFLGEYRGTAEQNTELNKVLLEGLEITPKNPESVIKPGSQTIASTPLMQKEEEKIDPNIIGWVRNVYYDPDLNSNRTEILPLMKGQKIPTNGTFIPLNTK